MGVTLEKVIYQANSSVAVSSSSDIAKSSSSVVVPDTTYTLDSVSFVGEEFKMSIDSVVEANLDTTVTTTMDSIAIDTLVITEKGFEDGVEFSSISDTTITRDTIEINVLIETLSYQPRVISSSEEISSSANTASCVTWESNICAISSKRLVKPTKL